MESGGYSFLISIWKSATLMPTAKMPGTHAPGDHDAHVVTGFLTDTRLTIMPGWGR